MSKPTLKKYIVTLPNGEAWHVGAPSEEVAKNIFTSDMFHSMFNGPNPKDVKVELDDD